MRSCPIKEFARVVLAMRNKALMTKKSNYGLERVTSTMYLLLRHRVMDSRHLSILC